MVTRDPPSKTQPSSDTRTDSPSKDGFTRNDREAEESASWKRYYGLPDTATDKDIQDRFKADQAKFPERWERAQLTKKKLQDAFKAGVDAFESRMFVD